MSLSGRKNDLGKDRWDLLPMAEVRQVVKVLTSGADKYGEYNWHQVDNGIERYYAAAMRHIVGWRTGESLDEETGLHHLAHAITNLLFIMHKERKQHEQLDYIGNSINRSGHKVQCQAGTSSEFQDKVRKEDERHLDELLRISDMLRWISKGRSDRSA